MNQGLVIIGVLCLVAAAVGGGVKLAGRQFPIISSRPRQIFLAAIGISAVLLGSGAVLGESPQNSGKSSSATTNGTRPTGSVSTGTSLLPGTSSSSTTVTIARAVSYIQLASEKYVTQSADACGSPKTGPFSVARTSYPQSVAIVMSCRTGGGPTYADYNVPANCTALEATVGIDDNAPTGARLTFEVLDANTGNDIVQPKTLGLNETLAINQPLTGVARVRLQITWIYQPNMETFNGVFGNARFVCQ